MNKFLMFIIVCGKFSFATSVSAPISSKLGNVTGGACKLDSDCILGCRADEKNNSTCIAKAEGNAKCVEGKVPSPGGLRCSCLKDLNKCGYVFPR